MKFYMITSLMFLICGYAATVESQPLFDTNTREKMKDILSIELLAQDFESKANNSLDKADKMHSIGLRSVAEKYQTLAEQYQTMVTICQNITCNTETSLREWLTFYEIWKTQLNEQHMRLADGYRDLAAAHEDIVTEIEATGYQGPLIRNHQEYSNMYKRKAAIVAGLLNVTSLEGNELKSQIETLATTENWIEAHSNSSRFLETINKTQFMERLNDLEKAAVNRMIAYNEISQLNKTLGTSLIAMEEKPFSDMIRASQTATEKVKEADRAYTKAHPKGKKATAADWIDVLNDLDKEVLNFHQEDGGCHNKFI